MTSPRNIQEQILHLISAYEDLVEKTLAKNKEMAEDFSASLAASELLNREKSKVLMAIESFGRNLPNQEFMRCLLHTAGLCEEDLLDDGGMIRDFKRLYHHDRKAFASIKAFYLKQYTKRFTMSSVDGGTFVPTSFWLHPDRFFAKVED